MLLFQEKKSSTVPGLEHHRSFTSLRVLQNKLPIAVSWGLGQIRIWAGACQVQQLTAEQGSEQASALSCFVPWGKELTEAYFLIALGGYMMDVCCWKLRQVREYHFYVTFFWVSFDNPSSMLVYFKHPCFLWWLGFTVGLIPICIAYQQVSSHYYCQWRAF